MPSDELTRKALDAVAGRSGRFRAAIGLTADQLRDRLKAQQAAGRGNDQIAATLGKFAAARVDPERFSAILAPAKAQDKAWAKAIDRAVKVLDELAKQGEGLFRVSVPAGSDLVAAVDATLANAGRAFAAARIANLAEASAYKPKEHDALLESFPFRAWSREERRLAPPLVIEVAGGDLQAAGLAAYLDGNQAFVILADGTAPAAPLARLISPDALVAQTDDAEALSLISQATGPAVIAVVGGETSRFANVPGTALEITHRPAQEPKRPVGTVSAFQQQQDLAVLAALASSPAPAESQSAMPELAAEAVTAAAAAPNGASANGGDAIDPVGALAAWILEQVDLSDLENATN